MDFFATCSWTCTGLGLSGMLPCGPGEILRRGDKWSKVITPQPLHYPNPYITPTPTLGLFSKVMLLKKFNFDRSGTKERISGVRDLRERDLVDYDNIYGVGQQQRCNTSTLVRLLELREEVLEERSSLPAGNTTGPSLHCSNVNYGNIWWRTCALFL